MRTAIPRLALVIILVVACFAGWRYMRKRPSTEPRIVPATSESYCLRANTHLNQKDYSLAIADFTQAIALAPADPSAYVGRGLAYYLTGDRERAASDFRAILTLIERQEPRALPLTPVQPLALK